MNPTAGVGDEIWNNPIGYDESYNLQQGMKDMTTKVYQRRDFMNGKLLIGTGSLTLESLAGQVAIVIGAGKSSIM